MVVASRLLLSNALLTRSVTFRGRPPLVRVAVGSVSLIFLNIGFNGTPLKNTITKLLTVAFTVLIVSSSS